MYFRDKVRNHISSIFKIDKQYFVRSEVLSFVKHFEYDKKENLYSFEYNENNISLRNLTSDFDVFRQVIINKEYFFLEELYKYYFKDNVKYIIDVGSNIGLTSLFFVYTFPDSDIYCIEADQLNFDLLKRNTGNLKNINSFNLGLWKKNEDLFVEKGFRDGREWSRRVTQQSNFLESTKVRGITLSEFLKENKIDSVDILKIDIEGTEKEVFLEDPSISNALERIKIIALEIHDESVSRVVLTNILHDHGFKIYSKGETVFGVNFKHSWFQS